MLDHVLDPPPPVHDPDEVRELADEILAREEFRPPARSLLDRIIDWIGDLFDFDADVPAGSAGGGGSTLVTLLVLLAAVVAVGFAVRALLRQPRRRRIAVEQEAPAEVEEHRTAAEWEAAAAQLEAAGDWKGGLRCRFRALVERLADDGAVADVPGRTAGEYRRELHESRPGAAEDFTRAADLFERAWYGDLPTGPDEARRFAGHADRVLADRATDRVMVDQ